jgi:hypothetical protein
MRITEQEQQGLIRFFEAGMRPSHKDRFRYFDDEREVVLVFRTLGESP